MSTISVLTTVNAPYAKQLSAQELAICLKDFGAAKRRPGHMSSFFGEVPLEDQKGFALANGVSEHELLRSAKAFSDYSGQSCPLGG